MSNVPLSDKTHDFSSLNSQQRHDLKSALLSVRWAAELLRPVDGSEPPCELIADQLMTAFRQLEPYIEGILSAKGIPSE